MLISKLDLMLFSPHRKGVGFRGDYENTKKRERSSESSRVNSCSYESESMGEFYAHSTDFDGFGDLWMFK